MEDNRKLTAGGNTLPKPLQAQSKAIYMPPTAEDTDVSEEFKQYLIFIMLLRRSQPLACHVIYRL